MATTYKAINNREDLNAALDTMFQGEQREWMRDYFAGKDLPSNASEPQRAFHETMDRLLRGMFDTKTTQAVLPNWWELWKKEIRPEEELNVFTARFVLQGGRLNKDEFEYLLALAKTNEAELTAKMGESFFSRTQALAIGLINGIADKMPGTDAYSVPESKEVLGDELVVRLYLKDGRNSQHFFEAVRQMNVACGDFLNEDMSDALPFDSLPPVSAAQPSKGGLDRG